MNRRDVLIGLGAGGLVACARTPRITLAQRINADVTLARGPKGAQLRSAFLGLSFEANQLADAATFSPDNHSLIALLQRLAPDGSLRIGGNSTEFGVWQRQPSALAAPFKFAITPAAIDRLAGFVEATGWRLIYGVNLGHGDPERAADEVAYLVERLGERLEAVQIGNEPDLYYRGLRPHDYSVDHYIAEWRRYAQAIHAQTPSAPLAGPDVAYRPEWINAFTQACGSEVRFISDHYYASGPANDPDIGISTLFLSERLHYPQLRAVAARNQLAGYPLRITEANTLYNGGKPNVSDTLGAALWASQLLFQMNVDGIRGINFHGGPSGPYTPIARDAASGLWQPRPLYYAMLLYAQAGAAHLVDVKVQTANTLLCAFGLLGEDGKSKLVLVNQSGALPIDLRVSGEQPFTSARALTLSASSLWRIDGVTLGGSAVDANGHWQPQRETLSVDSGSAYLTLSPASAMLVEFE